MAPRTCFRPLVGWHCVFGVNSTSGAFRFGSQPPSLSDERDFWFALHRLYFLDFGFCPYGHGSLVDVPCLGYMPNQKMISQV